MHEMALTENVVEIVLTHAKMANAEKVIQVKLKIGELRDVVDSLIEKCFRYMARGTVAAEAILEITKVPFVVKCGDCGSEYPESIGDCTQCRSCGSRNLELVSGKEFLVEEIKIV